ncbi:MAG: helix-turn-helix transcriptional regulator [Clostridia bacterium]|nr:helix-turn-helix transcriptional regulator [Clostridia bacterium]
MYIIEKLCMPQIKRLGVLDVSAVDMARLDKEWTNPNARAPFNRLYFVISGGGRVWVNGRPTDMTPGNAYLIPADSEFAYTCEDTLVKLYVHFSVPSLGKGDLLEDVKDCLSYNLGERKIRELAELAAGMDAAGAYAVISQITGIVSRVCRDRGIRGESRFSPPVRRALEFIEANKSAGVIGEKDVAAAVFVSVSRLRKLFREQVGMPIGQYISRGTLSAAELDLRITDLSVREISVAHGYCDQFYFSRVFKKHYGTSPAVYRKNILT